jgi:hypothetical protein
MTQKDKQQDKKKSNKLPPDNPNWSWSARLAQQTGPN